jgi:hypothetical protein
VKKILIYLILFFLPIHGFSAGLGSLDKSDWTAHQAKCQDRGWREDQCKETWEWLLKYQNVLADLVKKVKYRAGDSFDGQVEKIVCKKNADNTYGDLKYADVYGCTSGNTAKLKKYKIILQDQQQEHSVGPTANPPKKEPFSNGTAI